MAYPRVVLDPDDVPNRLAAISPQITLPLLRQALLDGYTAKVSCTENDPPFFKGTSFYARTTRSLRDQLVPQDWWKNDDRNFSRVISPDDRIAIAVMGGDSSTGNWSREPKTRSKKGPATIDAVEANIHQGELFPVDEVVTRAARAKNAITWVLLYATFLGQGRRTIRAEFSLPASMDADGRITKWAARIILPAIHDDYHSGKGVRGPEPTPDISISVRRRSS